MKCCCHYASTNSFTGCMTCRGRKVKCDELKPRCYKCSKLSLACRWGPQTSQSTPQNDHCSSALANVKFPQADILPYKVETLIDHGSVDRETIPYINHFVRFCSRFLIYADDSETNPFSRELVPSAIGCSALLHAVVALAAGHLARLQPGHDRTARNHYALALRELNIMLSNPNSARSDSTLGTCLLLCVYEVGDYQRYKPASRSIDR